MKVHDWRVFVQDMKRTALRKSMSESDIPSGTRVQITKVASNSISFASNDGSVKGKMDRGVFASCTQAVKPV